MASNKIVRSLCYFSEEADPGVFEKLKGVQQRLEGEGYTVQTRRACFDRASMAEAGAFCDDSMTFVSVGTLSREAVLGQVDDFIRFGNVSFNLDLTEGVEAADVELLFMIMRRAAHKMFSFTYVFNNPAGSPFFPAATYQQDGLAIGLQSTDLADSCTTLEGWLDSMKQVWAELMHILGERDDFLGIDSSVAPLFAGRSSFIHFVRRLHPSFCASVTSDSYVTITDFLKRQNPKPVGLCGLMFPCLEDFELTEEYEAGNFSLERNLFLSLHSGLGIDTYPIGVDESPQRVLELLRLLRALSNKYQKPLSARFVSDGSAKIGQHTSFGNPFLKDVVVRRL